MYFVTIDYPKASPFVLYQDKGATKNLEVIWNATKQEENLQGVIAGLLQAWGHGIAKIDRAEAGTSMSNRSKINDAPLGGLVVANQKKEGCVRKLLSGLEKVAKSPPGRER
ncbi:hypothetical protein FACS189488_14430 [Betaproteobacteria bacterium]|nr:hypothetical protein FACS189488_14430 [Betaproteobacteria bacterium]